MIEVSSVAHSNKKVAMPNALKAMIAGLVATLVLSALMLLNSAWDLMPQINVIRWLTALGTLSVPSAWMDHFIVGAVIWGLLFAAYDAVATRPAPWLKGIIFGVFAWMMMMVAFMPLAGAGFFGAKIGITAPVGLLILHIIYGAVLGATYEFLGVLVPLKAAVTLTKGENYEFIGVGPNPYTMNSADINDHLPTSSPSGKTVLILCGGLLVFLVLLVLAVEFRTTLGI
jgi:uncharacterized protein DUF6789